MAGQAISYVVWIHACKGRSPEVGTSCGLDSELYLIGTLMVTRVFNIPRNDALAAVEPSSASGAALWRDYVRGWTFWNTVRMAAALGAAALFTVAL